MCVKFEHSIQLSIIFPETLEYGASFYVDETFLATIFDEKVLKNSTFKNDEHFDSFQKFSLSPYMVPGRLRGHHREVPTKWYETSAAVIFIVV